MSTRRGGHLSVETLLSLCRNVRRTGNGRWLCSCPAHEDRHPSMNVREVEDGKVLVICRSGCSTQSILDALGLEWEALFPDKPAFALERELRKFPASDVLTALADEAMLVAVAASNLAQGVELTAEDRQRLITAANRFYNAVEMVNGKH